MEFYHEVGDCPNAARGLFARLKNYFALGKICFDGLKIKRRPV
jgi:hypothetical protein